MKIECDECGESHGEIHLKSRCHESDALAVKILDGDLIISCSFPECGQEVVRFTLGEEGECPTMN